MATKTQKTLPQIKHFVVLMLENRSLDSVLGWLYERDAPRHVIGRDLGVPYDGLVEGKFSNPLKRSPSSGLIEIIPVTKAAKKVRNIPTITPHEPYPNVTNQLFGDAEHAPVPTPPCALLPRAQGYLQDYYSTNKSTPEQVLQCYSPDSLPVLNELARNYAVSDRWFSSVPSQTNPNRAYFACGTSLRRESNLRYDADEQFASRTLWNVLSEHRVDWTIYFHDRWPVLKPKTCYTHHTFPFLNEAENHSGRERFLPIDRFYADARNGRLPPFTFLEPKWSYGIGSIVLSSGNDYHPPARVDRAERFVKDVYAALTSNRERWNETLLVITFDEHGGMYDHVAPPPCAATPPEADHIGRPCGFRFDRFGVRVPTLLVSPYAREKTVFRAMHGEYDHTSLTATILKWQGIDPAKWDLFARVAAAPTFEGALSDTPRSDVPEMPEPLGGVDEHEDEVGSPEVEALRERLSTLPVGVAKGICETAASPEEALALAGTVARERGLPSQ